MVLSDTRINFIGQVCWYIPKKIKPQSFYSTFVLYRNMGLQILTVEVSVPAIYFQTLLSGNVASVREQGKAPGEGRVSFQPHVLKHSIDQWVHVTPHDHTQLHAAGSELWIVELQQICNGFQRWSFSLAAQVLDLSLAADPSHKNPKWKKCVSSFLLHHSGPFSSTAPVHPDGFVLSIMAACSPLPQR